MRIKNEEIVARREKVSAYLQSHSNQWMVLSDVAKLMDCAAVTIRRDITSIIENGLGGSIEASHQGIMWVPDPVIVDTQEKIKKDAQAFAAFFKTEKKEEKIEKIEKTETTEILFAKGRNSEGYSDPTAAMAIRNAEPKTKTILSGDVWLSSRSDGRTDICLILRNLGDKSICVIIDKTATTKDGYIPYGWQKIDCTRISAKPNKYFTERADLVTPEVMSKVHEKLADILGIDIIVEAPAPAPVVPQVDEKKLRAEIEAEIKAEYEQKLTQQKIDIYERVLFGKREEVR